MIKKVGVSLSELLCPFKQSWYEPKARQKDMRHIFQKQSQSLGNLVGGK